MSTTTSWSRRRMIASAVSTATIAALPIQTSAVVEPQKMKGNQMISITPYLLFDGNCREAMEFYKRCFGGVLSVTSVKDSAAKDQMAAMQWNKTIYAKLKSANLEFSASDWLMPDRTRVHGNSVCLYLSGGTLPELQGLFAKLADGADATDPMAQTFHGAYGALNDRFGVRWMFQASTHE